jgi:hypothetical protein
VRRLLVLAVLLLSAVPAFAKLDGPQWAEAEKEFRRLFSEPGEADKKIEILKKIAGDGEPRAWKAMASVLAIESAHVGRLADEIAKNTTDLQTLLGKQRKEMYPADLERMNELQRGLSAGERARVEEERAFRALLASATGAPPEARKEFFVIGRGHREWAMRAAVARIAAAAPDDPMAKTVLTEAVEKDKDSRVKIAALDALQTAPGKAWYPFVLSRLEDPDWSVQLLAARIAGTREMGLAIPGLIKALSTATPRVSEEVVASLRKLTGQNMEAYPEPWAKWWEANRSKWGEDGRPLLPLVNAPRKEDIEYYGIKVRSDKVMFIIDISGSMKDPKQAAPSTPAPPPDPKAPPKPAGDPAKGSDAPEAGRPKFSGPKIEIAKQELKRALKSLTKDSMFCVIAFNHSVTQWQPKMVPATDQNKELAYGWIRDMAPSGSTYTDGALRMAFKMAGMGASDPAYGPHAPDTILLMSDGAPTDNSFPESKSMDPEEILAHVREWNPHKRVVIHCVGIDNVVVGIEFMKKLAAQNGGKYVDG